MLRQRRPAIRGAHGGAPSKGRPDALHSATRLLVMNNRSVSVARSLERDDTPDIEHGHHHTVLAGVVCSQIKSLHRVSGRVV